MNLLVRYIHYWHRPILFVLIVLFCTAIGFFFGSALTGFDIGVAIITFIYLFL